MSVHQQLRIAAQHGLRYTPHYFTDFLVNFKHCAQLHDGLSSRLKDSPKEVIEWFEFLFESLSLFRGLFGLFRVVLVLFLDDVNHL